MAEKFKIGNTVRIAYQPVISMIYGKLPKTLVGKIIDFETKDIAVINFNGEKHSFHISSLEKLKK